MFADAKDLREGLRSSRSGGQHRGAGRDGPSKVRFADGFLRFLGAVEPQALDYSDFEGAPAPLHDLNDPIPADWQAAHSVVIDGGDE